MSERALRRDSWPEVRWKAPQDITVRRPHPSRQVLNRGGGKYLARPRQGGDPGADMHCDTGHLAIYELYLPRVAARSDLHAEGADRLNDRQGASESTRRSVERREEPVPGSVDFPPA